MFRHRFQFSFILSICYLWLLVSPLAAACQCSMKQANSATQSLSHCESRADDIQQTDDLTPVQKTESCCASKSNAAQSVQTAATSFDQEPQADDSDCCVQKVDCLGCPSCNVQSVLVATVESPKQSVISDITHPVDHLLFSGNSFHSLANVDHPPDRPHLALHISTTVLRI